MSRFYVIEVTGYGIQTGSWSGRLSTSYSVLDSAQCHREVYDRFPDRGGNGNGRYDRRRACVREAERRNALDAAGCAA